MKSTRKRPVYGEGERSRHGQTRPSGVGFLLYGEEGGLGGLETDLKLTVFPSCLRITVLGSPPLPEEAPGIIADVRVRGV